MQCFDVQHRIPESLRCNISESARVFSEEEVREELKTTGGFIVDVETCEIQNGTSNTHEMERPKLFCKQLREMFDRCENVPSFRSSHLLLSFADSMIHWGKVPMFSHSRTKGTNTVLIPHCLYNNDLGFGTDGRDMPWHDKNPIAVWRGVFSGTSPSFIERHRNEPVPHPYALKSSRIDLMRNTWSNDDLFDTGFSCPFPDLSWVTTQTDVDDIAKFQKRGMGRDEMAQHKYHFIAEGWDTSSCLPWVLNYDMVPLMPPMVHETIINTSALQPWVHYVPLQQDFADVVEKVKWCQQNDDFCQQIALNGKSYMERFCDQDHEDGVMLKVLSKVLGSRE